MRITIIKECAGSVRPRPGHGIIHYMLKPTRGCQNPHRHPLIPEHPILRYYAQLPPSFPGDWHIIKAGFQINQRPDITPPGLVYELRYVG